MYEIKLFTYKLRASKSILLAATIFAASLFLLFFWTYRLDTMPGLHADEAWSGLKADYFNNHVIDQLDGMNNYTGILQTAVVQFTFRYLGVNVFNLRLAGVVFNFSGLAIICSGLLYYNYRKSTLVLILIFLQSALYLTSARVAWEVNTFNLFLFSIVFLSVINIYHNSNFKDGWILLIWVACLLGGYNHIIFSIIPLSCFLGLTLWSIYYRDNQFNKYCFVFGLAILNSAITYVSITFFKQIVLKLVFELPIIVSGIFVMELLVLKKSTRIGKIPFLSCKIFQVSIKILFIIG